MKQHNCTPFHDRPLAMGLNNFSGHGEMRPLMMWPRSSRPSTSQPSAQSLILPAVRRVRGTEKFGLSSFHQTNLRHSFSDTMLWYEQRLHIIRWPELRTIVAKIRNPQSLLSTIWYICFGSKISSSTIDNLSLRLWHPISLLFPVISDRVELGSHATSYAFTFHTSSATNRGSSL